MQCKIYVLQTKPNYKIHKMEGKTLFIALFNSCYGTSENVFLFSHNYYLVVNTSKFANWLQETIVYAPHVAQSTFLFGKLNICTLR
jgi:hypothetical protein